MNTAAFTAYREKVVSNCARVIVGKEDATEKILVSFLCGGHVLLEDKPGTGKTMTAGVIADEHEVQGLLTPVEGRVAQVTARFPGPVRAVRVW